MDGFKNVGASYLKLRDATENASGLRTGTQKLDFYEPKQPKRTVLMCAVSGG